MKKSTLFLPALLFLCCSLHAQKKKNEPPKKDSIAAAMEPVKKVAISEKIKGSRKYDGLFTLYQDTATGSIQMYVKREQLGPEFIY